jgi:alkylation response protein AidB-like acyl-CoA dehydrogenase
MNQQVISEHARAIADSALGFAEGSGGLIRARRMRDNWPAHDADVWKQMAELGWLGICVPEEQGGLGLAAGDMCVLLESVGKLLVPEPLVPSIAAASLLAACDGDAASRALEALIAGESIYLPALARTDAGFPLTLAHVPDCHAGASLIVAYGKGAQTQLRAVPADAPGMVVHASECVDGSSLAEITIPEDVWKKAALIGEGVALGSAADKVHDLMLLGYSSYLVGLMDAALQMTLSYMKIRQQFGTPIGSFQSLQHRAASCHVDILASRALLYEACAAFDTGRRSIAASAIKARASAAAMRVTKECVQFHGAIGFADEHDIGLYLRKAMSFAARMGGAMEHKLRFAQLFEQ